jgi:hypothetical protein
MDTQRIFPELPDDVRSLQPAAVDAPRMYRWNSDELRVVTLVSIYDQKGRRGTSNRRAMWVRM